MEGGPLNLSMEGTLYESGIFSAKNGNNHLHSFAMLLKQWRKKGQKNSDPDLCHASAVLHQLSYTVSGQLGAGNYVTHIL